MGGEGRCKRDLKGITLMVVCIWNDLLEEAIKADTMMTFKRHLDGYMDKMV